MQFRTPPLNFNKNQFKFYYHGNHHQHCSFSRNFNGGSYFFSYLIEKASLIFNNKNQLNFIIMSKSTITYKGFLATNSEAKKELKSLGAIRSIILNLEAYKATEEGKLIQKYLRRSKKEKAIYTKLAETVQKNKDGQTCIFWVARTALKLAKEEAK